MKITTFQVWFIRPPKLSTVVTITANVTIKAHSVLRCDQRIHNTKQCILILSAFFFLFYFSITRRVAFVRQHSFAFCGIHRINVDRFYRGLDFTIARLIGYFTACVNLFQAIESRLCFEQKWRVIQFLQAEWDNNTQLCHEWSISSTALAHL